VRRAGFALALALVAPAARAEESPRAFGERKQVALDDIIALGTGGSRFASPPIVPSGMVGGGAPIGYGGMIGYSHDEASRAVGQPGGYQSMADSAWLAPSVDVFVGGHVSIGGTISGSYADSISESFTFDRRVERRMGGGVGFGIGPRVGYVIPLGSSFALWPRLAIGYIGGLYEYELNPQGGAVGWYNSSWRGVADLGLVARVHRNVYLRAAPELVFTMSRFATRNDGSFNAVDDGRSLAFRVGATAGIGILLGG